MSQRLPILVIFMTVMLDSMGIGLIMPVMPQLIMEVSHEGLSGAAQWGGLMMLIFAVMQFLFGPLLGNLSDRYGRRLVILLSLFFLMIDYLIMAAAGTLWLLFIGRAIGGITSATHSTANAYIADISKPEEKAQNFGLISAAFGIGFILGPLVGGLLGEFGTRAPFLAAAGFAGLNLVLGFVLLPETVDDRIRRKFEWRRANPFGAFLQIGKVPGLTRLVVVFFIYNVAFFVYPAVWSYWTQAQFGWDPAMIGASLAAFGLGMAISQGGLIRVIVPRLGEHNSVLAGMTLNVLVFASYGLMTEGWQVFAIVPLSALAAIAMPAMMGIMSRTVPDDQQGELQGINSSVGAIAVIVSPLVMTQTFAVFTAEDAAFHFPGAPFALSGVLVVLALVVFAGRNRLGGGKAALAQ